MDVGQKPPGLIGGKRGGEEGKKEETDRQKIPKESVIGGEERVRQKEGGAGGPRRALIMPCTLVIVCNEDPCDVGVGDCLCTTRAKRKYIWQP
jgi:hypothetical protein